MRIAMPVFNSRVSPVFDTAQRIFIIDIEDGKEVARTEHVIAELLPWQRARLLSDKGVSDLICGAISLPMMNLLGFHGITVMRNIAGYIDEVLRAHTAGALLSPRFMMPGCFGPGRRRFRHGRGCRRM